MEKAMSHGQLESINIDQTSQEINVKQDFGKIRYVFETNNF